MATLREVVYPQFRLVAQYRCPKTHFAFISDLFKILAQKHIISTTAQFLSYEDPNILGLFDLSVSYRSMVTTVLCFTRWQRCYSGHIINYTSLVQVSEQIQHLGLERYN